MAKRKDKPSQESPDVSLILDLTKQGYSARDIADATDLTTDVIEQVIAQQQPPPDELPLTGGSDSHESADQVSALVSPHASAIQKLFNELQAREEQLANERRQIEQEQSAIEQQRAELEAERNTLPGHKETYEAFRQRMQQDKMTARYNFVLQELLDNSDDSRWSGPHRSKRRWLSSVMPTASMSVV